MAKGVWRCLLSAVKSRLTGASRASDIAIAQIVLMNGLHNGVVYDWASLLADRMDEFMTLQYKKFYMPHHAIGLFLDAVCTQITPGSQPLEPQGRVAPDQPPIFYWSHLDVLAHGAEARLGTKRKKPAMPETESDSEDFDAEEEDADSDKEESADTSQVSGGCFRLAGRGGDQLPEEEVMESVGTEGSAPAITVLSSHPARVQFTPARLPETCQLAVPRSFRTVSVVTTVPVPSFGQPRVTIAMTPPRVETTTGIDSGVASIHQDGPGILASAGASMEQDVPGVPGYMQEVMMEAGALQDDLSAWLSRY